MNATEQRAPELQWPEGYPRTAPAERESYLIQRESPAVYGVDETRSVSFAHQNASRSEDGRESRPFRDATAASGTAGTPTENAKSSQTCVSIGLRHIPSTRQTG